MTAVTDIPEIESEEGKQVEPNFDQNKKGKKKTKHFSVCSFQGVIKARERGNNE